MSKIQLVAPNLWTLSGSDISVRYSTISLIGPAGGPHLIYQGIQGTLKFSGTEIRSVSAPDLGTLVSVTLHKTVDTGSTTFTLLLPAANLVLQDPFSSIPIATEAITTIHAGPLSPPIGHGQHEFYTVTGLTGNASHVLAE